MKKNKHEWKKISETQWTYEVNQKGQVRNCKSKKLLDFHKGTSYRFYSPTQFMVKASVLRWKYFKGEITSEMYLNGWVKLNRINGYKGKTFNPAIFVNEYGDVYNKEQERVYSNVVTNRGYLATSIKEDSVSTVLHIHRVLALLFIPNPDNKTCVNHIDGDKLNNTLENLEWVTPKENTLHSIQTGLHEPALKKKRKRTQLSKDTETLTFDSRAEACAYLKCVPSTLNSAVSKHHKVRGWAVSFCTD